MKSEYVKFGDFIITKHERYLISLCFKYKEYWQIAEVMGITLGSMKQELKMIYRKLNLHSLKETLLYALANGFDHSGLYEGQELTHPTKQTAP